MALTRFEYIYYFIHKANTMIEPHYHRAYELCYYIEGQGESVVGDDTYRYMSGNFIIYPPEKVHNETHRTVTSVLCLTFYLSENVKIRDGLYSDKNGEILRLLNQIKDERYSGQYMDEEMIGCLTEQLVINLLRLQTADRTLGNEIYDIKKYIQDNFNLDINIDSIAKQSGYSYDHFRHLFKKHTGVSPKRYLTTIRLEHAKKLLATGTMFVSDISIYCGFANISEFSVIFKKYYGLSPTEYRKFYRTTESI